MTRYADYCSQVNHTPEWSNVYNRVNVRLHNSEFNGVTTKEVEIGEYLNTVGKVSLNEDVTGDVTMERVTQAAGIDVQSLLNDQSEGTSLFSIDDSKQAKRQLYLTQ